MPASRAARPHSSRFIAAAAFALAVLLPVSSTAADAPPGAYGCLGCHDDTGGNAALPSLKGRKAADILAAMKDYRAGKREPTVMDRIAKGFSDAQAEAVARWIAGRE